MPITVRVAVGAFLSLLLAGAIYLLVVRGPVMLLDLAGSAAAFICP